jgi:hypothetical protein
MSTMRSTGCPPIFIQTIGSWGPSRMEPGLSIPPHSFQACQYNNIFFPGAGSPAGGLIFSLDNLSSSSGLGDLLGVSGPLGTFILPLPFLTTVGTLISPQFLGQGLPGGICHHSWGLPLPLIGLSESLGTS